MRTLSKITWATVGVGSVGVLMGLGLMMAGDQLGRRDEAALRLAVSEPVRTTPTLTPRQEPLNALSAEAVARASQAVTVVSDQVRQVDLPQLLEATHGNPLQLLSQTRVVPHLDGSVSGLQVASLADSPWAQKVGLKVGDVVTAVNGEPILDPSKIDEVAQAIFSASNVDLTIQRGGRQLTLQYHMRSSP